MSALNIDSVCSLKMKLFGGRIGLPLMLIPVLLVSISVAMRLGAERPFQQLDVEHVEIRLVPVQGNVYSIMGIGGNITVQVGTDGVLLVDSQYAHVADRNLSAIRSLSDAPIGYIINTHMHGDHVHGNERLSKPDPTTTNGSDDHATIVAHENVLSRMSDPDINMPPTIWPTETYSGHQRTIHFNEEDIRLIHQPSAHTDGDSFVYFANSNVISVGDVYNGEIYPFIDRWNGGSIRGIIDGLTLLLHIMASQGGDDTKIVPGHGQVVGELDIIEYRDMLEIICGRIERMVHDGMSLDWIQAARPTREYDGRYGRDSGFWTTRQFVAAIVHDLTSSQ